MNRMLNPLRILILIGLLMGLGWISKPVQAATYTFNISNPPPPDSNDINPGDKQCLDASGKCSLRAALQEVNAGAVGDGYIINLSAGSHQLSLTPNLNIDHFVTINNNTGNLAMIRGISKTGTININNTIVGTRVTMNNVTISEFETAITHKMMLFTCNNCTIQYNKRGIQVTNGTATLNSSAVQDNEGSHCVGALITGGTLYAYGTGFSYNKTTSAVATDRGGAVCNTNGFLYLRDSSGIAFNTPKTVDAKKDGGGLYHTSQYTTSISNNSSIFSNEGRKGGGIYIGNGTLNLFTNTRVYSNNSSFDGGGVYIINAIANIQEETEIFNNTAPGYGGGIYADGDVKIDGAIIRNNQAELGGGIYHYDRYLSIDNSVINDNTATTTSISGGGGLAVNSLYDLEISNTTFSGNRSYYHGGGIFLTNGYVKLSNVTITNNTCDSDLNTTAALGGGIYVGGTAQLFLNNSILAGNIDPTGATRAHDIGGTLKSEGYNLIGECNSAFCAITGTTTGNIVGQPGSPVNPQLDPLTIQNEPHFTYFHPLKNTSPAVNAANPLGCKYPDGAMMALDQLGQARVQLERCDMGAVESAFTNANPVMQKVFLPLVQR